MAKGAIDLRLTFLKSELYLMRRNHSTFTFTVCSGFCQVSRGLTPQLSASTLGLGPPCATQNEGRKLASLRVKEGILWPHASSQAAHLIQKKS